MIKDNRINYQTNYNFILNKKNEPPKEVRSLSYRSNYGQMPLSLVVSTTLLRAMR